jgi:DNA modification methylase
LKTNILYYGDNLDILRNHTYFPDECVDLVYLDPPFNSNADYNVLFEEHSGEQAASQIKGFEDTWTWDIPAARYYEEVVESGGAISEAMQALRQMLGRSNMMAYVAYMAPRLVELRRVLKPTGSLYLHCDPTASHYLKLVLDAIFGPRNLVNEVIWKRSHAHNSAKRFGSIHDTLLFYGKSKNRYWKPVFQNYDPGYIAQHYKHVDPDGRRWKAENPTGAGVSKGDTGQPWRGINPTAKGRHWARSRKELEALDAAGLIYWPKASKRQTTGWPYIKLYLDQMQGAHAQDVWTDIDVLNMMAKERLGYPTQKPEELLARIISASAPDDGIVLDPFCGCGTAVAVAQRFGNKWIGIDITALAITLIKHRLQNQFGPAISGTYEVVGEPISVPDAAQLAKEDPYQFQFWALGLVGARPAQTEQKKGADRGIDGNIYFHDDPRGKTKRIILSVKGGANVNVAMVRDLVGTVTREKAELGVLISMTEPTKAMREETASAGFYTSPMGGKHPKVQILTIAQLLEGKSIDYPAQSQRVDRTFKRAKRVEDDARGKLQELFTFDDVNVPQADV